MTTILEQARTAVAADQYERISRAKELIRQQQQKLRGIAYRDNAIAGAVADLTNKLLVSGAIPADFLVTNAQLVREAEDRQVQQQILVGTLQAIEDERKSIRDSSANDSLSWLNRRLGELMDQIRSIPAEHVFPDAGSAITHGAKAVKAWTEMEQHAATYDDIRQAQITLLGEARNNVAYLHRDIYWAGLTRIPHDITYLAAIGEVRIGQVYGTTERTYLVSDPYPGAIYVDPTGATTWPSSDRHGYLRWLADRGDAWVPTNREIKDAVAARQVAMGRKSPMTDLIGDEMHGNLPHLSRIEQVTV